jgi:DNA segregation ATPase FtsK/SpoIIIE-like protein
MFARKSIIADLAQNAAFARGRYLPAAAKSVCINALIASMLFGSRPKSRFIMIDPKVVELQIYLLCRIWPSRW